MIEVKNLTKVYKTTLKTKGIFADFFARSYSESIAVNNLSFSIGEDELVGFVGPNGAGKTTTLKILCGLLYPDKGDIKVLSQNPFLKQKSFLKQIAFVMGQKNQLLWELPAIDSFYLNKAIYEIPDARFKKQLSLLSGMLDCEKFLNQPTKTLSLGQRMRMELISSLLHKPKVLFMDEPTIGLDIFAHTTIIKFIKEYQKETRATIILTSHYMKDIQELAKRVILIDHGQLVYDGELTTLLKSYSQEKIIKLILEDTEHLNYIKSLNLSFDYQSPVLTLKINKDQLLTVLEKLMKHFDLTDINIEDEGVEEIIKKVFTVFKK